MENKNYISFLTNIGLKKLSDAAVSSSKVSFTNFVYGDGNGKSTFPSPTQASLVHKLGQVKVISIEKNPISSNIIEIHAVIPADVGGFTIREIGVEDDTGDLIAVGNIPDTAKVILKDGICSEMELIMQISVANNDCVEYKLDGNIITITKSTFEKHTNNSNVHFTENEKMLLYNMDCGDFIEESKADIKIHNENPYSHREMKIDGNSEPVPDDSKSFYQHKNNANAHQNLIIDGGII